MKAGFVVFGMLVVVIGVFLFVWGSNNLQAGNGLLADMTPFVPASAREAQQSAQVTRVGGIAVGVVGLGMCAAGLLTRKK